MNAHALGKFLLVVGLLVVAAGLVLIFLGKIPGIGRLPGDLLIHRGNSIVYVPVTTCILLSIILTVLFRVFRS